MSINLLLVNRIRKQSERASRQRTFFQQSKTPLMGALCQTVLFGIMGKHVMVQRLLQVGNSCTQIQGHGLWSEGKVKTVNEEDRRSGSQFSKDRYILQEMVSFPYDMAQGECQRKTYITAFFFPLSFQGPLQISNLLILSKIIHHYQSHSSCN